MVENTDISVETPEALLIRGKNLYKNREFFKALEMLILSCKEMELKYGNVNEEMFEPYYLLAKCYYACGRLKQDIMDGLERIENIDEKNEGEQETKENQAVVENKKTEDLNYWQLSRESVMNAMRVLNVQIENNTVDEKQGDLRMANCRDLVGNIYLDSEDIEGALGEFKQVLQLRMKYSTGGDQAIEETHYNLGVVYMALELLADAIRHFELCKTIRDEQALDSYEIQDIISMCKGNLQDSSSATGTRSGVSQRETDEPLSKTRRI